NFYLRSKDDKIGFLGLFNEQIESINGPFDMELYIGGTPEAPAITSGYIQINNGEILLSRILDPIREVNVDIAIEDSVLQINKFEGYSIEEKDFLEKSWRLVKALIPWSGRKVDDGRLNIKGSIGLQNVIKPNLSLDISTDELYIDYFIENTKLLLTTESIKITGQDTIAIAGGIYIPKAEYEVDLTMMEKNVYLYDTSVKEAKPPYIDLNLDIQIPGGFNITSSPLDLTNNFKIGIQGDLRVIMEPASDVTQITGHLDVASGNYSSWNQNFEVQSGSIDFINPTVLNPDINIVASKMIGDKTFEVIINGDLESLTQQLRVIDKDGEEATDLSDADKIAMLTLGTDVQQLAENTDSTIINLGSQVATTSLLTAVERGAEEYTGLDRVQISSNDNILDFNKMRLNNGLKNASVSFGKYLTTDLYVEYRTQFNMDAGNRIGLQYRINKHWNLDSYYEKTIRGNNKVQLGINWEYSF
ncbi:MAG: translocation/assembly module TamB domain-containing protein, partial [Calditrichaceae bacterium]